MDIQSINTNSFSIYLDEGELQALHIDPRSVTEQEAADISRSALQSLGRDSESGAAYIELYPGKRELLLFVRTDLGEPVFFQFGDFEAVLAAAACLSPCPSALTYLGGKYILTLYPAPGQTFLAPCEEFGTRLSNPPRFDLHLREHGKTLSFPNAVAHLQNIFKPR